MNTEIKNRGLFTSLALQMGHILLVIALFAPSIQAQDEQATKKTLLSSEVPTLRFEHTGLEDGMSQSSANTIMQDSKGYLWIATQGGLHRFDGHEFKVYAAVPFDTTSLSESWVWAATEAKNGDIWVTTEGGGLNRLDPATGTSTHYRHDPNDSTSLSSDRTFYTMESRNGDLWVSTFNRGLDRMPAGRDGQFIHYSHKHEDPNTLTSNTLFWLTQDSEGMIWAGSSNGINRINPETEEITRFLYDPDTDPGYGAMQNVLGQYLPPDKPGIIWLATGNGLVRLDYANGSHTRFLIEPNGKRVNPLNFIHEVVPDPSDPNVLWVGGPGTGVARFDMRTESFTSYRHDPRDPHSLAENFVQSLFTDRSGKIWAGTASEGLSAFNPGAVNFTHLRHDPDNPSSLSPGIVWGIYEDQRGTLWVNTDVGAAGNYLTQMDPVSGGVTRHRHDPNNTNTLLPGSLRAFAEDARGQFWVGGANGLNKLNRSNGRVQRFRQEQRADNRGRNAIFAMFPTAADSSELWIGSIGGLDLFDTDSGRFTHVLLKSDDGELEPFVLSLYEDADRILWAGTRDGLFRRDPSGDVMLVSSYDPSDTTTVSQNEIVSIAERPGEPGILWLATQNGGLNRFDTKTGITTHYTTEDGLSSNSFYAVVVDNSGSLWMSTNNGISNYNPDTRIFRNYGLDDGLMALEYNQSAYAKGSNGVLYFGSGKGVTAFNPEQLHINEIPPQVVLSGIRLFNKPLVVGPNSPLHQPLEETESITLKYDQNELTFDFVALHYSNPGKNSYAYRLEGFDKDWVDAGSKRSATYTNLGPGDYTFHVKAANSDGVWNNEGASIKLSVLPPWYRTWWAYGLFVAVMATGIFGVDRFQRRRLTKKERERTALREAELKAEAENRRRADTEKLSEMGRAITSSLSVHKIIDTIYENINALMDAAIFGVGIYNEERNSLDFPATKEAGEMLPIYSYRLDEEDRLAVWCFNNKKEIIISDFKNEYSQYIRSYKPPVQGEDASSIIFLPLIQKDRVIGVLTTQSFQKNAFTPYHVNVLRNLATYAAIALDNAAAYRQLNATLSELRTMQQQLVQQEKLASLGQLTAGIAHEIKNPLNFVNNFSDLSIELIEEVREEIKEKKNGNSQLLTTILNDVESNLRKIHEHGNRADSIVKSMLQHSRGGSRIKEPTDINALVKEYVNLSFHGMRAGSKPINVEIALQLDKDLPKVPLIAEDFSRVIVNLCNNAFDAMREKPTKDGGPSTDEKNQNSGAYAPKLTMRTKAENGRVTIEIEDNGTGIPEDIKDNILQPFFTTKKGTEGTGLGLSISSDIIKAHGGTMEIESREGSFTKFIIKIPT